ncbi:MAG: hypothetical protein Hals2KO_15460 [Halioglobus sp.]
MNDTRLSGGTALALIAAIAFIYSVQARAQDAKAAASSEYFELHNYYDSVSFDVGPVLIFESPDQSRMRDLHVPAHEGRVRVGELNDYGTTYVSGRGDTRQAKLQIAKRLSAELETYLALLAVRYGEEFFSAENLMYRDPSQRPPYKRFGGMVPLGFMTSLAGNLLHEPYFKEYFCSRPGCGETRSRTLFRFGDRSQLAGAKKWGGATDEFSAMEAIETFIAKDRDKLFAWSKSLPLEIAAVGRVLLTEYDFARKGFPLQFTIPRFAALRTNGPAFEYWERDSSKFKVIEQSTTHALLAMNPSDAEKLLKEQNDKFRSPAVYFVVSGKVYGTYTTEPALRNRNRLIPLYELTDPDAVFYRDAALTQRIGTARMSSTP